MNRNYPLLLSAATIATVLALAIASSGQNTAEPADAEIQRLNSQVEQFFSLLSDGRQDEAFEDLLANSQALSRSPSIAELKRAAQELERRFGRYRGSEQVEARRVGKDVIVLKYLYKCDAFPVVWYFTFYRTAVLDEMPAPAVSWTLITVRFDTQVESLAPSAS